MDAAAVPQERKVVRNRRRDSEDLVKMERQLMRLHILTGSFFPPASAGDDDDDAGGGGGLGGCATAMDASVWTRLPDDMVWLVLGLVPPAKRFQLHLVSRKWRQVLTSPHFRNTIAAPAAEQQRVVACVTPGPVHIDRDPRTGSSKLSNRRVVDVDLSSLVPSWFWKRHRKNCTFGTKCSFSVVAAGDGLVCIANHLACLCDPELDMEGRLIRPAASAAARYCVLNPVSRTCAVLPAAPFGPQVPLRPLWWLPLSAGAAGAGALTLYRWDDEGRRLRLEVATCDLQLAAAGGGGGWGRWSVLHSPAVPAVPATHTPPVLAQCGGKVFWYHAGRLHVLAAPEAVAGGANRRRLEAEEVGGADVDAGELQVVEAVDGPSVALLGLDAAALGYQDERVFLVAYRGAIVLVAQLMRRAAAAGGAGTSTYTWDPDLLAGVWRLARRRSAEPSMVAWEPVARLDVGQAARLVQSEPVEGDVGVCGAFVVRDRLCLELGTFFRGLHSRLTGSGHHRTTDFVLQLNHDAGEWELLVDDQQLVELDSSAWRYRCAAGAVELRPH